MNSHRLRPFRTPMVLCSLVSAMLLLLTSATWGTAADSSGPVRLPSRTELHVVEQRECSQRVGPFVTQSTARQRLEEAKRRGFGVSGVFPCSDEFGTRGYCFNVFFRC